MYEGGTVELLLACADYFTPSDARRSRWNAAFAARRASTIARTSSLSLDPLNLRRFDIFLIEYGAMNFGSSDGLVTGAGP